MSKLNAPEIYIAFFISYGKGIWAHEIALNKIPLLQPRECRAAYDLFKKLITQGVLRTAYSASAGVKSRTALAGFLRTKSPLANRHPLASTSMC